MPSWCTLTPDQARALASREADRALALTRHPRTEGSNPHLSTSAYAYTYWHVALEMLHHAGDLTTAQLVIGLPLVRPTWTGTLDELLATITAISDR